MAVEYFAGGKSFLFQKWLSMSRPQFNSGRIRASLSMEDKNKVYKELGLFSLRKKIEDAVSRAEALAPSELELELAKKVKQEELFRENNPWDDPDKSSEILLALGDADETIGLLKELQYKAEEIKLVAQLAEVDSVNYWLFEQAYNTSMDVSNLLDRYEISKLLNEPYDKEGACVIIRSAPGNTTSDFWAEKLLHMYLKWAERQGIAGRVTEKYAAETGGIRSATVEFENQFGYGYLSGERGVHMMIRGMPGDSILCETGMACVDVMPLFLGAPPDVPIPDEDIEVSALLSHEEEDHHVYRMGRAASILHVPTGIRVQSSGERNHFTNKIKALNRLKAKLLLVAEQQGVSNIKNICRHSIPDLWQQKTRKYMFHPYKLVLDVETNIQFPDLVSILCGGLEPLFGARIRLRHTRTSSN